MFTNTRVYGHLRLRMFHLTACMEKCIGGGCGQLRCSVDAAWKETHIPAKLDKYLKSPKDGMRLNGNSCWSGCLFSTQTVKGQGDKCSLHFLFFPTTVLSPMKPPGSPSKTCWKKEDINTYLGVKKIHYIFWLHWVAYQGCVNEARKRYFSKKSISWKCCFRVAVVVGCVSELFLLTWIHKQGIDL